MEPSKTYNPADTEDKWYGYWMEKGYFRSTPDDREPFTIVIPPPNVTGVLHMGHMLNNTIQDVLIRRARMQGKNACWVPGTDHASIATEAKVVKMLADKGIMKKDLSREQFLEHAWEWTHKYGGIILDQLKKLGASCDWDRTRFTMEPKLYDAVIKVFVDMYRNGLIYRGTRMVNWDPQGRTTLSDEEVIFKPSQGKMVTVRYRFADGDGYLCVATVRPETIMGDVAIAVHPDDERYKNIIGKKVIVPFVNREVPVIADSSIDPAFGTGCLKVTPAHDYVDYEIGKRHGLEVIDVLNEDGTISAAGQVFVGMDRFAARKKALEQLEAEDLIEKIEDYQNNVGRSERTDAVVEPRLSTQWFVDMKKFMEKNPEVLSSVMDDDICFHPPKFKNTYRHWIENIKDWNISRQLWWGHRIPAWYDSSGRFVVAENENEALNLFEKEHGSRPDTLTQDPDVLDTWFSSWLWPISVFDGFENPDNEELNYYYPTNDLVTAPEIIFFWVARMVMAGYEYKRELPFRNVYFTGIVRDKQRRKMSKSLGNSPEPLELIAKYGADGVRMGMLLCSPAGNDILFDESQVEQGRNFSNKLWNAFRLIQGWQSVPDSQTAPEAVAANKTASEWFSGRMNQALKEIDHCFAEYRLSEALMLTYKLVWDDFCSWYLEMVKPPFGSPINMQALEATRSHFDALLRLLHPFMPFITEELHHQLYNGNPEKPCIISEWPAAGKENAFGDKALQVITEVRNLRNSKGLSPKEPLQAVIRGNETGYSQFDFLIRKLANLDSLSFNTEKPENCINVLVGTDELFISVPGGLDAEAERSRIQNEIEYLKGFLKSVEAKLSNEKFVANAKPDIVEKERQKHADAAEKIQSLEISLKQLS